MLKAVTALMLLVLSFLCFGQEVQPPSAQEIQDFFAALGGMKGASAMAIAIVVVQGVLLIMRSSFVQLKGFPKLIIVLSLTLVSGLLSLIASGMPFMTALLHSSTLAAFQVLGHQLIKHFFEKK